MGRGDLTDAEWERLRPFLPVSNGRCGRWRGHRQVIVAADPDAWLRLLTPHNSEDLADAEPTTMRVRLCRRPPAWPATRPPTTT